MSTFLLLTTLFLTSTAQDTSLTQCLINIFDKYFERTENFAILNSEESFMITDTNLIQSVNKEMKWGICQLQYERTEVEKVKIKMHNYLMELGDFREFLEDLTFLKDVAWNSQARFVIVANLTDINEVLRVFKKLWEYKVVHSIVLVPRQGKFDIHGWQPFGRGGCGTNNRTVVLDTCANGTMERSRHLFPEKIPRNLNKCPVRVRTIVWPPYVVQPKDFNRSTIGINFTQGLEIQMMNTVAKALNFTPVYTVSQKSEDWGSISENGTAFGIFKTLLNDEHDLAISCLASTPNRFLHFDPSVPYTTESLTWCIPSALLKPKWLSVFNIYEELTWIDIYVTFFIICIVSVVMAKKSDETTSYNDTGNCLINMYAVFMGLSLQNKPRNIPLRTIFFLCAFFNLVISSVYQTTLISFLTEPAFEKQISTIEEIFERRFNFFILPQTKIYFTGESTDWVATKLLETAAPCDDAMDCIQKIGRDRNYTMASPRLFLMYVVNNFMSKQGRPLIDWFQEDVMSFPVQIYMTRGFPLRGRINSYVTQILQTGIQDKWQDDLNFSQKERNGDLGENSSNNNDDPVILTMDQLQGAFLVLGIGLGVALIVLVAELVYYKHKQKVGKLRIILK